MNNDQAIAVRVADVYPHGFIASVLFPGPFLPGRIVEKMLNGNIDDAGRRTVIFDQGDIDGKFTIAFDEFLGAVQGIDQPETIPRLSLNERNILAFF